MRSFKLITMGTLWMWTRIFGIDLKIMIILRLAKLSVKGKFIVTVCFQFLKKNIQSCNFSDPISRWDETAFDPNYENLPLSEFRPMLKRILQRYIMVILYPGLDDVEVTELIILEWYFFLYVFRKPYDMAETRINCAIVAAKQELSRAYNFEEWKKITWISIS